MQNVNKMLRMLFHIACQSKTTNLIMAYKSKIIYVDFGQHLLYKCVIIIISLISNTILFYPIGLIVTLLIILLATITSRTCLVNNVLL